jgi:hypothetical protein
VPRFREYGELLELPLDELRTIAGGNGDAAERLWAAWALGMRHDGSAVQVARDRARRDPAPGVRANMAILLVSHGERSAAATLAKHDPEPLVRASACRSLARVVSAGDDALIDLLVAALGTERSPDVRAAIIDGASAGPPPPLREAIARRLNDEEEEVRAVAVQALLGWRVPDAPLPAALRDRWPVETSTALRDEIVRAWVAIEGSASVLHDCAGRPSAEVVIILNCLRRAKILI